MPPRLVATDLDGTLVGAGGLVSARTAQVLAAVDALGIPVVFVTARPLRWMGDIWPYVGRHSVGIVSNGAILYDPGADKVVDIAGIEPEVGQALLVDLAEALPDAGLGLEYASGLHRTVKYESDELPDASTVSDLRGPWLGPVAKMLVKDYSIPSEELRARTAEVIGDRATPTWSVPGLVEISAKGITKAWRLRELCRELGIDAADVVAFGDMPNDLDMLRWAGTSYAMANGHESVRAAATHLAPPNDEDGVARVLSELYGL